MLRDYSNLPRFCCFNRSLIDLCSNPFRWRFPLRFCRRVKILLLLFIFERIKLPPLITFKIGLRLIEIQSILNELLILLAQLIMLTQTVQNIGPNQNTLHAHIQINTHFIIIICSIVLDGIGIQSHQSLQQIVWSCFFEFVYLPFYF